MPFISVPIYTIPFSEWLILVTFLKNGFSTVSIEISSWDVGVAADIVVDGIINDENKTITTKIFNFLSRLSLT